MMSIREEYISMELAVFISIIGFIVSMLSFFLSRKDKSNKDTERTSYQQGKIDMTLANIEKKLDKIEGKLDFYDKEIEDKIKEALNHHIKEYHKGPVEK